MNRILRNIIWDILVIVASFYFSVLIRFYGIMSDLDNYEFFLLYVTLFVIVKLSLYYLFKFHLIIWNYASVTDILTIIIVSILSNSILLFFNFIGLIKLPNSIFIIATLLDIVLLVSVKFYQKIKSYFIDKNVSKVTKVLIIGAGEAGSRLIDDIKKNHKLKYEIVGIIDDQKEKLHKLINGVEVLGSIKNTKKIVEKYNIDKVVLAIPSLSKKTRFDVIEKMGIPLNMISTVPSLKEIVEDKKDINTIKEINIQDLLGREEIILDRTITNKLFKDKTVLISGGGGSIGGELARQVAKMKPKQLILLDIYENGVYDIQNEIMKANKNINLLVLIESIRDRNRIDAVFSNYKPDIVLHAAAHKHVPLMEHSPQSAVLNNVFGTHNMVRAAHENGVGIFLQISTDKAVNPTNIMGATKRIDEMIVNSYNSISDTKFTCVRFGNVLGSNGSVVPLFKKQIERGGPVTVTDERITRFFMTIPEACSLVLETATKSKGGEIFILDMGQPVKIIDLAETMIKLSGYKNIKIEITGLRPGEKLYEELLVDPQKANKTDNKKIFVEDAELFDYEYIQNELQELEEIVLSNNTEALIEKIEKLVPTFNRMTN